MAGPLDVIIVGSGLGGDIALTRVVQEQFDNRTLRSLCRRSTQPEGSSNHDPRTRRVNIRNGGGHSVRPLLHSIALQLGP